MQGDASTAIAGFPFTNANYEHSVTLLKTRFCQSYKQTNAHMQALLDMSCPTNSLSNLQQFHDTIESHIHSLSSLGKDTESYGALLVLIILSKLPNKTKKNLARSHPTADWRLEELQTAIQAEIRIFETGLSNTHPVYQLPAASFILLLTILTHHKKVLPLKRSTVSTAREAMLHPFALSFLTLQNV